MRTHALAPGGDAAGRQEDGANVGRVTFIPFAAPGELVTAKLVREDARVAWADLVAVVAPSATRVVPACPQFGRCGGCQWQHVDLAAQREAKKQIVQRALGLAHVPLITPALDGRGYRERARLFVGPGGELGFRARRSHDVVDAPQCLLLAPQLEGAVQAIRLRSDLPPQTVVELQLGREGVHARVTSVDAKSVAGSDAHSLLQRWGPAAAVVGVRVESEGGALLSTAGLADVNVAEATSPPLRVPAGGFTQVGRAANQALVDALLQAALADHHRSAPLETPLGVLAELYAGSGNFTRHLLPLASQIVVCEGDPAALDRARRNVEPLAVRARLLGEPQFCLRPPRDITPDVVVADPPRVGFDSDAMAIALRARRRVVYVSCDPQTLGRDAKRLHTAGFRLAGATAIDMMPHTFHVEVVARFDRESGV